MAAAPTTSPDGQRDGLVAALGSIVVLSVALLLAPVRDALGLANVALILTLVVVGAATIGGRIAGVVTAVVGALGFNAIHARPYGTLRIDRPEDLLTCVLMVVVGVAVGQVAHTAAERGRRAASDRTGMGHVHALRDLVASRAPSHELLARSGQCLSDQLRLRSWTFQWGDEPAAGPDGPLPDLGRDGSIPGPMRHGIGGFELPHAGVSLPVRSADGRVLGRFVLVPTRGHGVAFADREIAVLVADVVGPALEAGAPGSQASAPGAATPVDGEQSRSDG